jgi:hypothetical protein
MPRTENSEEPLLPRVRDALRELPEFRAVAILHASRPDKRLPLNRSHFR